MPANNSTVTDLRKELMTSTSVMCRLVFRSYRTGNCNGIDEKKLANAIKAIKEATKYLQDDDTTNITLSVAAESF